MADGFRNAEMGFRAGLQDESGVSGAKCGPGWATFDKTKPFWFVCKYGVAAGGSIGRDGKETYGPLVGKPGAGVAESLDGTFADFSVLNFSSG
jgi:hypothetical protein